MDSFRRHFIGLRMRGSHGPNQLPKPITTSRIDGFHSIKCMEKYLTIYRVPGPCAVNKITTIHMIVITWSMHNCTIITCTHTRTWTLDMYMDTGMRYEVWRNGHGECVYPLNQQNSDNSKFTDVLKHFIKFREMHCLTNTQLNQRVRETLSHTQIYRQIEFTIVAKSNITDSNYRCY